MSNLSQQIGQIVQANINTLSNSMTDLENKEQFITPTLIYTDAQLFQYGIQITQMKVLMDQANQAVITYTLTGAEASAIAALDVRAQAVYATYITAMIARAPSLFT